MDKASEEERRKRVSGFDEDEDQGLLAKNVIPSRYQSASSRPNARRLRKFKGYLMPTPMKRGRLDKLGSTLCLCGSDRGCMTLIPATPNVYRTLIQPNQGGKPPKIQESSIEPGDIPFQILSPNFGHVAVWKNKVLDFGGSAVDP